MTSRLRVLAISLVAMLGACEVSDIDTDPFEDAPDITGSYQVTSESPEGCDDHQDLLAWAEGPLEITGAPDLLTFDFGDGMDFFGLVDPDFGFEFEGVRAEEDWSLDVLGEGVAYFLDGAWALDGNLSAPATHSSHADCTITMGFEAVVDDGSGE